MAKPEAIQVEGLREFQQAVRRSVDRNLGKRIGQAHKDIGRLIITKLDPRPDPLAVGTGAGASVRPSATKREVVLRAGGAHRAAGDKTRLQPWGRRRVGAVGIGRPKRPHIIGTADKHRDEIFDAYREAVAQAMRPAFHDTNP